MNSARCSESSETLNRQAHGPLRVLVVTPFKAKDWSWLSSYFDARMVKWKFACKQILGKKQHHYLIHALKSTGSIDQFDLVFSHGPYMTLYIGVAMKLRNARIPHIATTFNHGNQRFFSGLSKILAKWVLPDVKLFIVFSEYERNLLGKLYAIPMCKMSFTHWAVRPPEICAPRPDYLLRLQPYVCCIGRNNRDFETFIGAMRGLPINAVIVAGKGRLDEKDLPKNILLQTEISKSEANQILAGSRVSVVPLNDASTGAGHMTIVNALLLGKPLIVSDVPTVREYFKNGVHGLAVERGSIASLRQALLRFITDEKLVSSLSRNALNFSAHWLNEQAAARSLKEILECHISGRPYPLEPVGWGDFKRNNWGIEKSNDTPGESVSAHSSD